MLIIRGMNRDRDWAAEAEVGDTPVVVLGPACKSSGSGGGIGTGGTMLSAEGEARECDEPGPRVVRDELLRVNRAETERPLRGEPGGSGVGAAEETFVDDAGVSWPPVMTPSKTDHLRLLRLVVDRCVPSPPVPDPAVVGLDLEPAWLALL